MRAHVHELDLVGLEKERIGDALVDGSARDGGHSVGDRLEMLHVQGADDVDAGVPDGLHILPALRPHGAGGVRVGQLVHEDHGGSADHHGLGVHLLDDDAAVLDAASGDDLEALHQGTHDGSPVRLHEAHRDVGAPVGATMALLQHAIGLADTGRHAQVDAQPAPGITLLLLQAHQHLLRPWAARRRRRAPGGPGSWLASWGCWWLAAHG